MIVAIMTTALSGTVWADTEVTYNFSEIEGFSDWGTSYSQHVVSYDEATVTFASANHQTSTINDIPVTKGQEVILVLNSANNVLKGATFTCRQWGTKAQTITLHYSTDGGSTYTSTGITSTNFTISSSSLPEGTNAVKITFSNISNQVGIESASITYAPNTSSAVATTTTISNSGITNTDVYTSTEAGSLSASVKETVSGNAISGATVTWSSSDTGVATIDEDGNVTLVAAGTTTITANYAGVTGQYQSSSATYTMTVTDSTPFTGGNVTFDATKDKGNTTAGAGSIVKNSVTFSCSNGILGNGTEYRLYKNSVTTFSVSEGTITQIEFTGTSDKPASGFGSQTGWTTDGNNGTWTGNATSVSFTASGDQVRATQIVVTVDLSATPDPVITASNVNLAYDETSGSIDYTLENATGIVSASVPSGSWITLGTVTSTAVPFTCEANPNTTARTETVTLTYGSVTKDVTITQAAAPQVYSTIPALFAAATSTETSTYVTFNNWVVSGVSTNGKNVFVTDNNGNGLVIFDNNGGLDATYAAGNILSGTAIPCDLVLYGGSAELKNLDASNLTITSGGTVTVADVAMANLAGVNTGAVVSYENLTCSVNNNKYYLTDGTTTLQVFNSLYAFDELEAGKTYNITGVYQQYNSTKEILPRSAADIVEVEASTYTITAGTLTNVTIDELWDNNMDDIELGTSVAAGTTVNFSLSVEDGYTIESVSVLNANNVEITLTESSGSWYFTMPNSNVTINATAVQGSVTPVTGNKYVKVTSTADLTDGQYLIVYEDGSVAFDGSLETLDAVGNTIDVTVSNNEIAATTETTAAEFTISAYSANDWTIKSASGLYIGLMSDSNGLTANANTLFRNVISFDEDGNTNIVGSGGAYLRYNSASNQTRFRFYKSSSYTGQQAIQLYKFVESTTPEPITVSLNAYGYATFASAEPVCIPEDGDFTAWKITDVDEGVISFSQITGAVAAGTGVFLKGTAEATVSIDVVTSGEEVSGNLLVGFPTSEPIDADEYYGLKGAEFIPLNAGNVKAGKALLPASAVTGTGSGEGVKALTFSFEDDATSIQTIDNGLQTTDAIYNVAGQRLQKMQKGINIVNGKKILK